jgi:predicted enzyme related to lactoylglutathione lyase
MEQPWRCTQAKALDRIETIFPPGRCRPGLNVANLDDFHRRMVEKNVRCLQEPMEVFGTRVAQYADPDGLTISVGEEKRGS